MRAEGYGGRGGNLSDDNSVLDGITGMDEQPAGAHRRKCLSVFCRRWFTSRQYGDFYCCERCDLDMNPQFAADRRPEDND